MADDFPVEDKIVMVTGGSSGIGLACVQVALDHGAKAVIIADLKLTAECDKLIAQNDCKAFFERCDVTSWRDLQNVIDMSLKRLHDVPDVYVASAGVFEPSYSNFWEDPEGLDVDGYKTVDINVNHPIKLTRIAIRSVLGKNKKGAVAIVASIAGYTKQYPAPIYSATKHAVVGFTRSLGEAQAIQGVKVVAICPGIVATPIWTVGTPGAGERFGISDSISLTSKQVAKCLFETLSSGKYPGGTIREISKAGTRLIPDWRITPPGEIDNEMVQGSATPAEAHIRVMRQITEATEKERGTLTS